MAAIGRIDRLSLEMRPPIDLMDMKLRWILERAKMAFQNIGQNGELFLSYDIDKFQFVFE